MAAGIVTAYNAGKCCKKISCLKCCKKDAEDGAYNAGKCFKNFSCLKCCKKDEEEDGGVYTSTNVNVSFVCCGGNSVRGHDTFRAEYIKNAKPDKNIKLVRESKETQV